LSSQAPSTFVFGTAGRGKSYQGVPSVVDNFDPKKLLPSPKPKKLPWKYRIQAILGRTVRWAVDYDLRTARQAGFATGVELDLPADYIRSIYPELQVYGGNFEEHEKFIDYTSKLLQLEATAPVEAALRNFLSKFHIKAEHTRNSSIPGVKDIYSIIRAPQVREQIADLNCFGRTYECGEWFARAFPFDKKFAYRYPVVDRFMATEYYSLQYALWAVRSVLLLAPVIDEEFLEKGRILKLSQGTYDKVMRFWSELQAELEAAGLNPTP